MHIGQRVAVRAISLAQYGHGLVVGVTLRSRLTSRLERVHRLDHEEEDGGGNEDECDERIQEEAVADLGIVRRW